MQRLVGIVTGILPCTSLNTNIDSIVTAGVLINIECKAWAKNIFYDRYERRGSVHFELMVDRA